MVIDTSAIFAAIADETDSVIYRVAIKTAPIRLMSAVTLLEARIVLFSRIGPEAIATLDKLMERAEINEVPFDREQSEAAFDAFKRYGKGQAHSAKLNIIDCSGLRTGTIARSPVAIQG